MPPPGPSLLYPSKKEVLEEMSDAGVQGLSHMKWAEIQDRQVDAQCGTSVQCTSTQHASQGAVRVRAAAVTPTKRTPSLRSRQYLATFYRHADVHVLAMTSHVPSGMPTGTRLSVVSNATF